MRPVFRLASLGTFGSFGLLFGLLASTPWASAGTFSTPHFIQMGEHAVGVEPEVILTNGAGVGANLRYTFGLTDINNVSAILGTGTGPRRFRFGGNMTFDFIPDVEGQPGIGIAAQGVYYRFPNQGQLEVLAIPYIHKTFIAGTNEVEPFLTVPFGIGFSEGRYQAITSLTIGALFMGTEKIRTVLEFGIAINHTDSYISGGVVYYP